MDKTKEELRIFFEALADVDRLKIVGELAKGNTRIQTLGAEIGMKPAKVVAHLQKLIETGVITLKHLEKGEQTFEINTDALEKMAQRQFGQASQRRAEADVRQFPPDFTEEDRKVVKNFTRPSGVIKEIPLQQKKQLVLLRYVLQHILHALEPGKHYPEKQVNTIFQRFHRDAAFFRRGLVDLGYLNRYADGSAYWLSEEAVTMKAAREVAHE